MTVYPILFIKYPFEITKIDGETLAVGIEEGADAFHGVINLENDSAEFMFRKLLDGITLPDLIVECMKRYDNAPVEEVGPKVLSFLQTLKENNILAEDRTRGLQVDESKLPKK